MMSTRKAGLHKDVSVIFNGVWDPEVDNIQPSFFDDWPKEARFATIAKVFIKAPGHIFSSKRRREKKRLLSISKHLLINMSS